LRRTGYGPAQWDEFLARMWTEASEDEEKFKAVMGWDGERLRRAMAVARRTANRRRRAGEQPATGQPA
jgi:hypothetical protein